MRLRIVNTASRPRAELTLYVPPRHADAEPIAWRVVPLRRRTRTDVALDSFELDVSWNEGRTGVRTSLESLRETFVVEPKRGMVHIRRTGTNTRRGIVVASEVHLSDGIACGLRVDGRLLLREEPIAFRQRITIVAGRILHAAMTRGAIEGQPLDSASVVQDFPPIAWRDATLTLRGNLASGYVLT